MNDSMRELHQVLAGRVQELSRRMDTVKTAAEAQAVVREMQEFNHRVMLAGSLLFSAEAAGLAARVKKVTEAAARVDGAIAGIGKVGKALGVVGDFLALVDEVIDAAKLAAR